MRVVLVCSLLIACGGGASGSETPPDAHDPPPDAPELEPTKLGLVELYLHPPLFLGPRLEIKGGFIDAFDPRCHRSTVGACEISDCPQALNGTDFADPGKLTFSPSNGVIAFTPGPTTLSFSANTVPWAANEAITLTTTGGDVPAFSASVASPRTLDAGEGREVVGPPLVRSQPFTATWVPIAEQVKLVIEQNRDTPSGPFTLVIACVVAGASGSATVPPAALSRLIPTANGGLNIDVIAHAMRETTTVAGDFAVTYRVLRSFDERFIHGVE
jgi:hypothetical protein